MRKTTKKNLPWQSVHSNIRQNHHHDKQIMIFFLVSYWTASKFNCKIYPFKNIENSVYGAFFLQIVKNTRVSSIHDRLLIQQLQRPYGTRNSRIPVHSPNSGTQIRNSLRRKQQFDQKYLLIFEQKKKKNYVWRRRRECGSSVEAHIWRYTVKNYEIRAKINGARVYTSTLEHDLTCRSLPKVVIFFLSSFSQPPTLCLRPSPATTRTPEHSPPAPRVCTLYANRYVGWLFF